MARNEIVTPTVGAAEGIKNGENLYRRLGRIPDAFARP